MAHPFLSRCVPQYAPLLAPIKPTSKAGVRKLEELTRSHKRFCERQLSNKKTSRVLEVALGVEMATAYMNEVGQCCCSCFMHSVYFAQLKLDRCLVRLRSHP